MQACNRKINGKPCAQSHTFYNYQEISTKVGPNNCQQVHPSTSIFGSLVFSFLGSPAGLHLPYVFRVRNFVLYIAPWVCQPQIMLATLSDGVAFPLPFRQWFRWNWSRYWVSGIRTLFPFILWCQLLPHFHQLLSTLRLLFHTTPL